jgi:hypothetical protein
MDLNSTQINALIVQYIREVVREELHQQDPKDWDISDHTDELVDLIHEQINNATITIDV